MNWFVRGAYIFAFVLIPLPGSISTGAPGGFSDWEKKTTATITKGDISVLFRDNSASPEILSGIQPLFNIKSAHDFDAYDPSAKGAWFGNDSSAHRIA